ncbi:MAG: rhodanese-like domain-containing protein [Methylovulum sp.]|nr:rhodanese-like domain-containing protein [Methylovulum sp.]
MSVITLRYSGFILAIALSVPSAFAVAEPAVNAESLSPAQADSLYTNSKVLIIDVRENDEWNNQHIPNAIHIPLGQLTKRLPELEPYKNSAIVTQCNTGKRSLQALKLLKSAGFTQVYSMEGGLVAWQKTGLPVQ